jgi:hypothetical protein
VRTLIERLRFKKFQLARGVGAISKNESDPARVERIMSELEELRDRVDQLEETLQKIVQWADAYPLDIFPKPDYARARALLEAGGMTLDAISADCMWHVVEGVGKIAREALERRTP